MKRIDLIRTLEEAGCVLVRHGGKHDWYRNRSPFKGFRSADFTPFPLVRYCVP
jgi:hypothetical protein